MVRRKPGLCWTFALLALLALSIKPIEARSFLREGRQTQADASSLTSTSTLPHIEGDNSTESVCLNLNHQCGGMGFIATTLNCCAGLECQDYDVFTSRCVEATEAQSAMKALGQISPQTRISNKAMVQGERYNYGQVLYLSLLFYEAQRSGKLPENKRIPWRGDSGLDDRGAYGEDLTGGWFDDGGYVKFGLPQAWSTTVLTWGLLEYTDAYVQAGEYEAMLDSIRWPLDYFKKCHVSQDEFYVQVGDQADYGYWGPPEAMNMPRTAFKVTCENPGTEPVAETAAAMAAGYLAFKDVDPEYAESLLSHARQLYDFGSRCQGHYIEDGQIMAAAPFYNSFTGYKDELAWGALWLYKATGEQSYLDQAKALYPECCGGPSTGFFNYDDKTVGVQLLLYKISGDSSYSGAVTNFLKPWLSKGWMAYSSAYLTGGPNKSLASASLIALMAADAGINPEAFRRFAKTQMHYLLGYDEHGIEQPQPAAVEAAAQGGGGGVASQGGPAKDQQQGAGNFSAPARSYVIGFGNAYPRAPHHRASSCESQHTNQTCSCSTEPNYFLLYGALVGGPDVKDTYTDACPDFQQNEVCIACNAAFQSAVAGLKHLEMQQQQQGGGRRRVW